MHSEGASTLLQALFAGWSLVLLAWLGGAILTLPLERLLRPAVRLGGRPPAAWCLHLGVWTLLFSALLLFTWRPGFAAGVALALCLLLVLVNNAKFHALQEPFLFSDFGLFSQALRHPRLYLPFLGMGPAVAAAGAIALALYLGLTLEPPLSAALGIAGVLAAAASGLGTAAVLLGVGSRLARPPSLDPRRDLVELGLAASLWLYWRIERLDRQPSAPPSTLPHRLRPRPNRRLPDIVAVQNESFCDARRLWQGVRPGLLPNLDRARDTAVSHGRLEVPAWGANTMRTEFGFLSGIAPDRLGVHRFNPYRHFARQPIPSLAALLRSIGYYTVCIHPHPVSFFARDKVYPQLGFDRFIDLQHFDRRETCGPYVCDAAVTRMIRRVLAEASGPVFVFAITMENHGPLHLERVAPGDHQALYRQAPPTGFDDLTVYLRHLVNADRMLGDLLDTLAERTDPGLLCWFGDHVPSMPLVYSATGHEDGRTDYLVWQPQQAGSLQRDLAVHQLAAEVLAAAGLIRD